MDYRRFNDTLVVRIDKVEVFGRRLSAATVSATCEMIIHVIDGEVDRYLDEEVGLNLFRFC